MSSSLEHCKGEFPCFSGRAKCFFSRTRRRAAHQYIKKRTSKCFQPMALDVTLAANRIPHQNLSSFLCTSNWNHNLQNWIRDLQWISSSYIHDSSFHYMHSLVLQKKICFFFFHTRMYLIPFRRQGCLFPVSWQSKAFLQHRHAWSFLRKLLKCCEISKIDTIHTPPMRLVLIFPSQNIGNDT